MTTTLFLDTRANELLNYEDAIEREKKYVAEGYSFENWLREEYDADDLYRFFLEQEDIDQAKDELERLYQEVLQEIAEDNLNRPAAHDWKVYTVNI